MNANTSHILNKSLTAGSISLSEIGFDFDGVIADTAESFLRIAGDKYGYPSLTKKDITNFELEECINIPKDIVEKIFTEIMLDSIGTGVMPMDGAVEALSSFAENETVTIITARPIERPVHDWLEKYFQPQVLGQISVIATGDHNDKIRYIHANGIKYFIDDRVDTCKSLVVENIVPIVFHQPWNEGRHNLAQVATWDDITNMVRLPHQDT